MAQQHATPAPDPSELAAARRSFAEQAWGRQGATLFRLAHLVCQDEGQASTALVHAFATVSSAGPPFPAGRQLTRELARSTVLACTETMPALSGPATTSEPLEEGGLPLRGRALLALVVYGEHTYREAATVLHTDREAAAQELRSALRSVADGRDIGEAL